MVEPTNETPEGFTRVQRRSPFLDLVGELYLRDDADAPVYGLRINLSMPTTAATLTVEC